MVRFGMKFSVGPLTIEWGEDGFRSVEWWGARRWKLWSVGKGWAFDRAPLAESCAAQG